MWMYWTIKLSMQFACHVAVVSGNAGSSTEVISVLPVLCNLEKSEMITVAEALVLHPLLEN